VPGTYYLPWREGTYTVSTDQKITMACKANGSPYHHKNVMFRDMSGLKTINMGWITYLSGVMEEEQYLFITPPVVHHPTPQISIQAVWMTKELSVDLNNKKFSAAHQEWKGRQGSDHLWKQLHKKFE